MNSLEEELTKLSNFNLIKYTDHYVLTIDRGIGRPIIIEGDNLEQIEAEFKSYKMSLL